MLTGTSGRGGSRIGTGLILFGLLLAAAAPLGRLLPYDREVLGESCLAPDYAGEDCAHFRRIAAPPASAAAAAIPQLPSFPVEARFLLLSSNELAGTAAPRAGAAPRVSRRFTAERLCAAPSRHRPDRPCPRRSGRGVTRPR